MDPEEIENTKEQYTNGSPEPTAATPASGQTNDGGTDFDAVIKQAKSLKAAAAERGIGHKASVEVKGVAAVKVRKPKPHEWVRVHPDTEQFSLMLPMVRFDDDTKPVAEKGAKITKPVEYYIHPVLQDHPDLSDDATGLKEFSLTITRMGSVFIWEHSVLNQANTWVDAEEQNILAARTQWVRQISDNNEGTYNRKECGQAFGAPKWLTGLDFEALLVQGLGDKFVSSTEHPLFDKLLGRDFPKGK